MTQIDYEITIFYKENFHLFLALGALPLNPRQGGLIKVIVTPHWTPLIAVKWAVFPPR